MQRDWSLPSKERKESENPAVDADQPRHWSSLSSQRPDAPDSVELTNIGLSASDRNQHLDECYHCKCFRPPWDVNGNKNVLKRLDPVLSALFTRKPRWAGLRSRFDRVRKLAKADPSHDGLMGNPNGSQESIRRVRPVHVRFAMPLWSNCTSVSVRAILCLLVVTPKFGSLSIPLFRCETTGSPALSSSAHPGRQSSCWRFQELATQAVLSLPGVNVQRTGEGVLALDGLKCSKSSYDSSMTQ